MLIFIYRSWHYFIGQEIDSFMENIDEMLIFIAETH